jgi:hypothetical protein
MRHVSRRAACAAGGLAFLFACLTLQPHAAPVPTGSFLPGYSAMCAR